MTETDNPHYTHHHHHYHEQLETFHHHFYDHYQCRDDLLRKSLKRAMAWLGRLGSNERFLDFVLAQYEIKFMSLKSKSLFTLSTLKLYSLFFACVITLNLSAIISISFYFIFIQKL